MNEYTKQATDFLKKANATMNIEFVGLAVNKDWKERERRNLYEITLSTPRGSMVFDFWDSIHNTEITQLKGKKAAAIPTAYDILACMTKFDPGTFENFCSDFGYDEDSRTAEKIYFAAQKEYAQLAKIFTPEQLEEMQEIN